MANGMDQQIRSRDQRGLHTGSVAVRNADKRNPPVNRRVDPSALPQPIRKTDSKGRTTVVADRLHPSVDHGYVTPSGEFVNSAHAKTPAAALDSAMTHADRAGVNVKLATRDRVTGAVHTHGVVHPGRDA